MNITPIQSSIDTSTIPIEDLAGNKNLSAQQKIHEASRQFESVMLQQIISEMQKPVIKSEFTDDSTASGIYQGYISQALAESMSKSGTFGFAKIFEQQLSPHAAHVQHKTPTAAPEESAVKNANSLSVKHP